MMIGFNRATLDDAALLHAWRTDPITRQQSHSSGEISWESHLHWFEESLKNPARQIYLATHDSVRVGMIRCDHIANAKFLSWLVSPDQRGRGFGSEMLGQFVRQIPSIYYAEIKTGNLASVRMAEAAGFRIEEELNGYKRWKYSPES